MALFLLAQLDAGSGLHQERLLRLIEGERRALRPVLVDAPRDLRAEGEPAGAAVEVGIEDRIGPGSVYGLTQVLAYGLGSQLISSPSGGCGGSQS